MDHDREIAEFISPFRQKQSSKGTCQENLSTVHGCFGLGTARVKALGVLKKERKKKTKMTKLDFHRFQVRHFSNNFEQSPCYCKMGQRPRADLSVFGRLKFITRRNISVWTLIDSSGANSHLIQIFMLRPLQIMFIPIGWQKLFQATITTASNVVATIWLLLSSFLISRNP